MDQQVKQSIRYIPLEEFKQAISKQVLACQTPKELAEICLKGLEVALEKDKETLAIKPD